MQGPRIYGCLQCRTSYEPARSAQITYNDEDDDEHWRASAKDMFADDKSMQSCPKRHNQRGGIMNVSKIYLAVYFRTF
jgi:hypothetical protein